MNERIEELAKMAWSVVDNDQLIKFPNSSDLKRDLAFRKEFSELIIRECANCVVDDYVIYDHFGIEK